MVATQRGVLDFINYWRRSFLCASAARVFATAVQGSVSRSGQALWRLVQDVGMVTMWRVHGDRYLQMLDMVVPPMTESSGRATALRRGSRHPDPR